MKNQKLPKIAEMMVKEYETNNELTELTELTALDGKDFI